MGPWREPVCAMSYAVVIPAYNEAKTVRDIAQRALAQAQQVIVVDDGSCDFTADVVRDLPVILLCNETNQGKAASLWRGAWHALGLGADAVITLDADGQHLPEIIPRLIDAARGRCIVIGVRRGDRSLIPSSRYYANKIANFWISWACGQRIEDTQSGFRLYPTELFKQLAIPHNKAHGFVFESEILIEAARQGYRIVGVPIPAVYASDTRASHFRQIDSLRITRMVAWKLLSRGLYPQGFWRTFIRPGKIG